MADRLFLAQSSEACSEITDLYDFVWPTAVGMWNLRWQVAGYLQAQTSATVDDLEARFVGGSKIHGANLRRACIDKSWDAQQEQFAHFLLINLCAIYEGWLGAALEVIGGSDAEAKNLQFPSGTSRSGKKSGFSAALARLHVNESQVIVSALYPGLRAHSKNSRTKIESLLKCYRYFKEMRNVLMHGGGKAGIKLITAYADFATITAATELDLKEIPAHYAPSLGSPVAVSLRGVVGFSGLLIRLITTMDAELARAAGAEKVLRDKWVAIIGKSTTLPPKGTTQRTKRLRGCLKKLGFPFHGANVATLEKWAFKQRLVT